MLDLINVGSTANDHTGDSLRTAGQKLNIDIQDLITIKSGYVDVRDWTAWDSTGGAAVDLSLQAAINQACAAQIPLYIPPGTPLISNAWGPINLSPIPLNRLIMIGAGGSYSAANGSAPLWASPVKSTTTFITNSLVLPAFTVNSARGNVTRGFSIIGPNVAPNNINVPNGIRSNYIATGCRDSQWSPHVAIALDTFQCAMPTDGGYPGLSGIGPYAGTITNASSQIALNNSGGLLQMGMSVTFGTTVGTGAGGVVSGTNYYITLATATYIQVSASWGGSTITFNAGGTSNVTGSWYMGGNNTFSSSGIFGGCSAMFFDDINILQFVVGVGHTLSGLGGLSDTTTYRNMRVLACATPFVTTQAQAKMVRLDGGIWGGGQIGLDGLSYGAQAGCPPTLTGKVQIGGYQAFNFSDSNGSFEIESAYYESTRTMGCWGNNTSSARGAMTVIGGGFGHRTVNYGPLPPIQLESWGLASFTGSNIDCDANLPAWNLVGNGAAIKCRDVSFRGTGTSGVAPFIGAHVAGLKFATARLEDCRTSDSVSITDTPGLTSLNSGANRLSTTGQANFYDNGLQFLAQGSGVITVPTVSALTLSTTAVTFTDNSGAGLLLGATSATLSSSWGGVTGCYNILFSDSEVIPVLLTNGSTAVKWYNSFLNGLTGAVTASATVQNTGLTFTTGSPLLVQAGDIGFWKVLAQGSSTTKYSVPAFKVSSVNNSTGAVVATLLWDATQYDTVANQPSTTSLVIAQTMWAPVSALTAVLDGSTAVITGVSPTGILKNGDWVIGSSGIPSNTRVVSGGGTATVTLSNNTTAAVTATLWFGRLYNPSTSSPAA